MPKHSDSDVVEVVKQDMRLVIVRRVSELQQRMDLSPGSFTERDQRELDSLKKVVGEFGATKSMLH